MPSSVANVAFDCADPHGLATWWTGVVGGELDPSEGPGSDEAAVVRDGVTFFFQRVAEPKTRKNRVHVCLRPDVGRDDEVARVVAHGAAIVDDRRADGGWVVLADPEGNEFCVLAGSAERAATG